MILMIFLYFLWKEENALLALQGTTSFIGLILMTQTLIMTGKTLARKSVVVKSDSFLEKENVMTETQIQKTDVLIAKSMNFTLAMRQQSRFAIFAETKSDQEANFATMETLETARAARRTAQDHCRAGAAQRGVIHSQIDALKLFAGTPR